MFVQWAFTLLPASNSTFCSVTIVLTPNRYNTISVLSFLNKETVLLDWDSGPHLLWCLQFQFLFGSEHRMKKKQTFISVTHYAHCTYDPCVIHTCVLIYFSQCDTLMFNYANKNPLTILVSNLQCLYGYTNYKWCHLWQQKSNQSQCWVLKCIFVSLQNVKGLCNEQNCINKLCYTSIKPIKATQICHECQ